MTDVLLLGAGRIGGMIATLLHQSGDYNLLVGDADAARLDRLASTLDVETTLLDAGDGQALARAMDGRFAVLSALPYHHNATIAETARATGTHYLDLTEDVASIPAFKALAADADSAFIPQCGLAPGFISIAAYDLCRRFDALETVHLRVGALPRYPSNALKYHLTWSTDGLINEYCNPCQAIVDGSLTDVAPLEELENLALDGEVYEAFNTSGGLGTLCDSLDGRVRTLNYRTIRYPGHRDILKVLLRDLRLAERRDVLKDILEYAIPATDQDVVLIVVTVTGQRDGRFVQESLARKVYAREGASGTWSAIQVTTASGICAVLDLLVAGLIPSRGFVRQEDIALDAFIANRFGKILAGAEDNGGAALVRIDDLNAGTAAQ